jgi:hypothetical protein
MNLEIGRSTGNGAYARKGTNSRMIVASRPKGSFYWMATPVPDFMDVCGIMGTVERVTCEGALASL